MSSTKIGTVKMTYTADVMKSLNAFMLRKIPNESKYDKLQAFIINFHQNNLSTVIKRTVAPLYLQERYKDQQQIQITRGGAIRENKNLARKKLNTVKLDTAEDKINNEIRSILTKLSHDNKTKLFSDFKNCQITDACADVIVENIYTFAIDLNYILKIYVELIFLLKDKHLAMYQQLIRKIMSVAQKPIVFEGTEDLDAGGGSKSKRWRVSNIKLLSEIYTQKPTEIDLKQIKILIENLMKNLLDHYDNLEILCELLKNILPILINQDKDLVESIIDQLDPIAYDPKCDLRYRFLIQDVMEVYNYDPED